MADLPAVERTVSGLRERVRAWRAAGRTVGLAPTMGALHDGHMALVRAARAECDHVVASIFVNPAQFGPREDFDSYPRQKARDLAMLREAGVEVAFMPDVAEVYPEGFATTVTVSGLTECLCGRDRPVHFQGVATVVTKLLLQCLPDAAFFGEKDFQQLQVIRRLARDLDIPVAIRGVETVREAGDVALSSRNAYLTSAQRARAPAMIAALRHVAVRLGEGITAAEACAEGCRMLDEAGFDRIDYLEIREEDGLVLVDARPVPSRPARAFAAAFLGDTRLIDNWPV
ncbi:MAG: pantoate--beta-alanine ligase [Alphaproteobacteria bacterium]|nr:pantoate--beta-alanine ligase [Alphaproteobacteria bacterium]